MNIFRRSRVAHPLAINARDITLSFGQFIPNQPPRTDRSHYLLRDGDIVASQRSDAAVLLRDRHCGCTYQLTVWDIPSK
jgi:hypothetical protein